MGTFNRFFNPQSAKLTTVNPAGIDAGNDRWRLLFDADTSERASWPTVLRPYNNGTLKDLNFKAKCFADDIIESYDENKRLQNQ